MTYEKATAEVVLFDNSDVITASYCIDSYGRDGCPHNSGSTWPVNGFDARDRCRNRGRRRYPPHQTQSETKSNGESSQMIEAHF